MQWVDSATFEEPQEGIETEAVENVAQPDQGADGPPDATRRARTRPAQCELLRFNEGINEM